MAWVDHKPLRPHSMCARMLWPKSPHFRRLDGVLAARSIPVELSLGLAFVLMNDQRDPRLVRNQKALNPEGIERYLPY